MSKSRFPERPEPGRSLTRQTARLAAAVVLVALAGCSPMTVDSTSEPNWSPAGWRTYSWRPLPGGSLGDPRVDEDLIVRQVRGRVDVELAAKGYSKSEDGEADFQVGHWLALRMYNEGGPRPEDTNWVSLDRPPGYWDAAMTIPAAHIEKGTIGVYFVDEREQRNVWRGWARGVMDFKAKPSKREERIEKAVHRILRDFPDAGSDP